MKNAPTKRRNEKPKFRIQWFRANNGLEPEFIAQNLSANIILLDMMKKEGDAITREQHRLMDFAFEHGYAESLRRKKARGGVKL